MDPASFVSQGRELYVGQFRTFIAQQKRRFPNGGSEKKYALAANVGLFRDMYCYDFVSNAGVAAIDPNPETAELLPEQDLDFQPITGTYGDAALRIEFLRWYDLVIYHDASPPLDRLRDWFALWFDPENKRHDPQSDIEGVVHSLQVEPGKLSTDLGTAPVDAFWDLLELLERAGAKTLRVTAWRDEAQAPSPGGNA